jgi:hypothetical protein
VMGLMASSTISIQLHVLAVLITCLKQAPDIAPGQQQLFHKGQGGQPPLYYQLQWPSNNAYPVQNPQWTSGHEIIQMPERKLLAWRPRPFPSFAPSIIPGRSSSCKMDTWRVIHSRKIKVDFTLASQHKKYKNWEPTCTHVKVKNVLTTKHCSFQRSVIVADESKTKAVLNLPESWPLDIWSHLARMSKLWTHMMPPGHFNVRQNWPMYC